MWRLLVVWSRLLFNRASQRFSREPETGGLDNILLSSLQKELFRLFLHIHMFAKSIDLSQCDFNRSTNRKERNGDLS